MTSTLLDQMHTKGTAGMAARAADAAARAPRGGMPWPAPQEIKARAQSQQINARAFQQRRPEASFSNAMQSRPEVVSRVTVIRHLLRHENVFAARRILDLLPVAAFEEPGIKRLRRALTPPVVRASDFRDPGRTGAYEWLRTHGPGYAGQWVAVGEEGLLATAPTLRQLRESLKLLGLAQPPLIHKL